METFSATSENMSIKCVVISIAEGSIDLDPDYQRGYVWDNRRASLLIDSIMRGFPIPPIYGHLEHMTGVCAIVDGKQRLMSIQRFLNNEFALILDEPSEITDRYFEQFTKSQQRILNNASLTFIKLRGDKPSAMEAFRRLNVSNVTLTPQELRNCIFAGPFNDCVKTLANDKIFREFASRYRIKGRMGCEETIVRFLAMQSQPKSSRNYGSLKRFLDEFMDQTKDAEIPTQIRNSLCKSVQLYDIITGNDLKFQKASMDFIEIVVATLMDIDPAVIVRNLHSLQKDLRIIAVELYPKMFPVGGKTTRARRQMLADACDRVFTKNIYYK
jgi:hypothetical protein